jgi:hypothetical protein
VITPGRVVPSLPRKAAVFVLDFFLAMIRCSWARVAVRAGRELLLPSGSHLRYDHFMAKSIVVGPKKRGRPSTGGRDPLTSVRLPPELGKAIDTWALKTGGGITRSEAIRRLVEIGLKRGGKR